MRPDLDGSWRGRLTGLITAPQRAAAAEATAGKRAGSTPKFKLKFGAAGFNDKNLLIEHAGFLFFAKDLEARTNGAVQVDCIGNNQICNQLDCVKKALQGIVDIFAASTQRRTPPGRRRMTTPSTTRTCSRRGRREWSIAGRAPRPLRGVAHAIAAERVAPAGSKPGKDGHPHFLLDDGADRRRGRDPAAFFQLPVGLVQHHHPLALSLGHLDGGVVQHQDQGAPFVQRVARALSLPGPVRLPGAGRDAVGRGRAAGDLPHL